MKYWHSWGCNIKSIAKKPQKTEWQSLQGCVIDGHFFKNMIKVNRKKIWLKLIEKSSTIAFRRKISRQHPVRSINSEREPRSKN